MTAPVIAQSVPIVLGSSSARISPDWWRWLREIGAVVTDLEGLSVIANGSALTNLSLVAGNNTIAHGLGATPIGWYATRQQGAFGTVGSSELIYPPIESFTRDVQREQRESSPTSRVIFTLGFTPADGATLLALIGIDNNSSSVSTITQTGVTWEKIVRAYSATFTDGMELWIGHTIAGAGTTVQVDASGALPAPASHITLATIQTSDIDGTAARGSVGGEVGTLGTGESSIDVEDYLTLPTPSAGDLVVSAWGNTISGTYETPRMNGWIDSLVAQTDAVSAAHMEMFHRTAQTTAKQSVMGRKSASAAHVFLQATFPTSLSPIGGQVTVPHGLREVSSDATNLVLESVSAMTVDLWVAK